MSDTPYTPGSEAIRAADALGDPTVGAYVSVPPPPLPPAEHSGTIVARPDRVEHYDADGRLLHTTPIPPPQTGNDR